MTWERGFPPRGVTPEQLTLADVEMVCAAIRSAGYPPETRMWVTAGRRGALDHLFAYGPPAGQAPPGQPSAREQEPAAVGWAWTPKRVLRNWVPPGSAE